MPLFPLGVTYLPHTSHVLNIFEPRYRSMYNDILMSGARRFAVVNIDQETGRLAEVGSIFYLDELKEVSEQTQDRVKYVGQHSVIGRVRLRKVRHRLRVSGRQRARRPANAPRSPSPHPAHHSQPTAPSRPARQVLNPSVMATRETYLRAEVEAIADVDDAVDTSADEAAAASQFANLVDVQAKLNEEPRFTASVKGTLSFARGEEPRPAARPTGEGDESGDDGEESEEEKVEKGLWGTILLWQQFLEQRMQVVGQKMQREIQRQVVEYLKEGSIAEEMINSRGEMKIEDLPPELRNEIVSIQRRAREELDAMESDPYGLQFQRMLQCDSHARRLAVFAGVVETEAKRLSARSTLRSMFGDGDVKKDEGL